MRDLLSGIEVLRVVGGQETVIARLVDDPDTVQTCDCCTERYPACLAFHAASGRLLVSVELLPYNSTPSNGIPAGTRTFALSGLASMHELALSYDPAAQSFGLRVPVSPGRARPGRPIRRLHRPRHPAAGSRKRHPFSVRDAGVRGRKLGPVGDPAGSGAGVRELDPVHRQRRRDHPRRPGGAGGSPPRPGSCPAAGVPVDECSLSRRARSAKRGPTAGNRHYRNRAALVGRLPTDVPVRSWSASCVGVFVGALFGFVVLMLGAAAGGGG